MNEKEKMIKGKLYKASDEELFRERQNAKRAIFAFNSLPPDDIQK